MRQLTSVVVRCALVLIFSLPAFAGPFNDIALQGDCPSGVCTGTPIGLTGTPGGFNLNLNIANFGAFGDPAGIFGSLFPSGTYSISNSAPITYSTGGVSCGANCFNLAGSANFTLYNGNGTVALAGILSPLTISQTSGGSGVFNEALAINLTILSGAAGGTLAHEFVGSDGILTLELLFQSTTGLGALTPSQNLFAGVQNGDLSPVNVPLPEPASLTLVGAGLLGFAALCRKKKLFPS
jgi:hypothetical protein